MDNKDKLILELRNIVVSLNNIITILSIDNIMDSFNLTDAAHKALIFAETHGNEILKGILNSHGVENVSDLPTEKIKSFIASISNYAEPLQSSSRPTTPSSVDNQVLSKGEIIAAGMELARKKGKDAVVKLNTELGIPKLGQITPDKYAQASILLRAALND